MNADISPTPAEPAAAALGAAPDAPAAFALAAAALAAAPLAPAASAPAASAPAASALAGPALARPAGQWPWPPAEQLSLPYRAFASLRHWPPKRRAIGAGMALYLLSPVIAELCSGATPALSYVFFGWMLCLMYGGGAILIREFTLRWGKGWPTILALGVAYGIAEEGIAVRTFFDRTAPVDQPLGGYGWAGGVNWVMATHLGLYHAVISIAIPIFLVWLAYPSRRNEPWVSARWLKRAAAGYVGVHIFWLLAYQRPVAGGYIVASLVAITGLILLARRLPAMIELPAWLEDPLGSARTALRAATGGSPAGTGGATGGSPAGTGGATGGSAAGTGATPVGRTRHAPTPRRVAIVAFAATFTVFWMDWGKGLGLPMAGAVAVMIATAAVTGWWFVRSSRRPGWTDRHRFAIAAGVFFFLPVFSPFIELSGSRGTLAVGIISGWLFVRQWRRLRAREATDPAIPPAPDGVPPIVASWPPPEQPSRVYGVFAAVRHWPPKRRAIGAGMALYLLSPAVAELCSGSTPIFSYLLLGWMMCLMYGGGAILIREFTLRWGKGWPTILALGVAYAISEEGIAVRTFFDRGAPPVQGLGSYGWFGGVNWVWSTHLSLYHAVISIAVPIGLVMLAYPARRNEPWVSNRWLAKAAAGYVGVILFWLVFYHRPVNGIYMIASFAAIGGLIWLARRLPTTIRVAPGSGPVPTPKRVAMVAFAATFGVFLLGWGRGLGFLAPLQTISIMLVIAVATGWWLLRGSQRPGWTDRHRYALAAGIFFFLPVVSPLAELIGARGQVFVAIVTAWLLVRQWRRLRAREAAEPMRESAAVAAGPATEPAAS
jgi:hypothetical protein